MIGQLQRVCRIEEIPGSLLPADALERYSDQAYLCLLENPGEPSDLGRYSFLCTDPFLVFRSKDAEAHAGPPGAMVPVEGDPFDVLKSLLQRYHVPSGWKMGLPPFLGGAVGYFGYEMLYRIEEIPNVGLDDLALPDSQFIFCDTLLAHDGLLGKSWMIANGFGGTSEEAERHAERRLAEMKSRLEGLKPGKRDAYSEKIKHMGAEIRQKRARLADEDLAKNGIRPQVDHDGYLAMVETAKEHIFAGDVFEVCTTNRFDMDFPGPGLDLYRVLREVNQAPMASYLRFPDVEVVSSSPERFLSLDRDRWAQTRPIKGTRPRGKTVEEDLAFIEDLATCEKDQAENVMIVDLARNDLGRVCEFGTVRVPEDRIIETYPYTHQLVSTVQGRIPPDCHAIDLIRAAYPGGSMTGAPKIEAMKIIDRLEPVKRGIYSGSIGYLDFDGSFDLNIVIRSFVKKGSHVSFHVGGAIVADSDPEQEYQETLDKAHGLVTALEIARQESKLTQLQA